MLSVIGATALKSPETFGLGKKTSRVFTLAVAPLIIVSLNFKTKISYSV